MSLWQRIQQRLREALGIRSPSAEAAKHYATVAADFQRGLEEGKENPLYRITEDGRIEQLREMTPEEKNALAVARKILARSFPGYFDDEEDPNGV